MSIKIYNGYRLEVGPDAAFSSVMETISSYRSYMREAVEKWLLREHVHTATREYVLNMLEGAGLVTTQATDEEAKQSRKSSPWSYAYDIRKDFSMTDPGQEFTFTLHQDPKTPGYLYILVFSASHNLTATFEEKFLGDSLVDYSYWNNSDRPDEVSAKEWTKRKKVWERTGILSAAPSEVGLSMQTRGKYGPTPLDLNDRYPILNEATANSFIPSFAERVDMGVEQLLNRRRREVAEKENPQEDPVDMLLRIINEVAREVRDNTPEVQEVRKEVEQLLPEEITVQALGFNTW